MNRRRTSFRSSPFKRSTFQYSQPSNEPPPTASVAALDGEAWLSPFSSLIEPFSCKWAV